jgi:restriction endonuclease S subunit
MSLPALYQLRTEYVELMTKLADMDLDAQTLSDTIESTGVVESFNEKAANVVMVARQFDAHCDAIDSEIERLKALKTSRQNTADKLRDYLLNNMMAAQIESIDHPLMSIKIRNNPESVEVFEEKLIPSDYMTWPKMPDPKPNKTLIKTALKSGQDIPGCKIVRTHSLTIK